MKRKTKLQMTFGVLLLAGFIAFTLSLTCVDQQPIGPNGSCVAYAKFNQQIHNLFGVNMILYNITDWAGIAVILIAFGFAILGLLQWIKRKKLMNVDSSILVLGGFYIIVFSVYVFFEFHVINYRPILINGNFEASYPSSTTMLAMCILPTAMMQFRRLINNVNIRNAVNGFCGLFTVFMVLGRLISGVHWFTDILGGLLFSSSMVLLYCAINNFILEKKVL